MSPVSRVQVMEVAKQTSVELRSGDAYGEGALLDNSTVWEDTIIASFPKTQVLFLQKHDIEEVRALHHALFINCKKLMFVV